MFICVGTIGLILLSSLFFIFIVPKVQEVIEAKIEEEVKGRVQQLLSVSVTEMMLLKHCIECNV